MEYTRSTYLKRLVSSMGSDQVKIITGVRRCGKSYLLNILFKKHLLDAGVREDHIVQVDFDGFRNRRYRDPETFLALLDERVSAEEGRYFLLLDEVQLLDEFAEVLNDLIRMESVDVYVTGSNAHLLSRDVVTESRGRGHEIRLRPLSFSEFMEGYDGDRRDGYDEYSLYGGLPAVTQMEDASEKADYLKSVFEETYIRDMVERDGIRDVGSFREIIDVLCSDIGCLTNPGKIANTFLSKRGSKVSRDTVERYIEHLEDAFLFEKAQRYDVKGRKYIGAGAKWYATDIGLRNVRMNFRQYEQTHILENIVYNELRGRGFGVDVGVVPAQRRDSGGHAHRVTYEIDFVCNRGSQRYYVQSAFDLPDERKMAQEQRPLLRVDDYFKRVIVTAAGPAPHHNEEGVLLLNVYDFLLDPDSLDL